MKPVPLLRSSPIRGTVLSLVRGFDRGWQQTRQQSALSASITEVKTAVPKPPLSALPPGPLLRSLLIATVSSKPRLLGPSLSILSALSKTDKSSFFNVDRNPALRWFLKRTFYQHFCGGEDHDEVRSFIKHMKAMGCSGTIVTYAREIVFDHHSGEQHGMGIASSDSNGRQRSAYIEAWRKGTLGTAEMLSRGDILALKLTGAGPEVTEAFVADKLPPQQMLDALDNVYAVCKERGASIIVDAESQHFQKGINRLAVELMSKHNRDGHARIYNTYQAYLKSTPQVVEEHLSSAARGGWTLGLKIVRGAYIATEERSLIHDTKEATDNAYNAISQGALKQEIGRFGRAQKFPSLNLLLATHNKFSALSALQTHRERTQANLPTVPVMFAQLQGMSDEVTFSLLQMKDSSGNLPRVLKCTTWGTLSECLAYLVRRAVENRDAVSRTQDEYLALRSELRRRVWPL